MDSQASLRDGRLQSAIRQLRAMRSLNSELVDTAWDLRVEAQRLREKSVALLARCRMLPMRPGRRTPSTSRSQESGCREAA